MKHSYTILLAILLIVIAISVFFPHSQFVEGLDMDDLEKKFDKDSGDAKDSEDNNNDDVDDVDDVDDDHTGKNIDGEVMGNDTEKHCTTYTNDSDGSKMTMCQPFTNKQKDNMDLVKAGNSIEDHDTTETFANWNPL